MITNSINEQCKCASRIPQEADKRKVSRKSLSSVSRILTIIDCSFSEVAILCYSEENLQDYASLSSVSCRLLAVRLPLNGQIRFTTFQVVDHNLDIKASF
jgi:hypothetical protein